MAKHRWNVSPSAQTGVSAVLALVMVGFVIAVWTGLVDLQGSTTATPRAAGSEPEPSPSAVPSEVAAPPESTLWLTFDRRNFGPSGAQRFADIDDRWQGVEQRANDGKLTVVPGPPGRGLAVHTPPKCPPDVSCPTATVEVDDADALDPGGADFSYGAKVRLLPDEASQGGNVVQKGYFQAPGGQWTLHVDTLDGHPSCVVEGVLAGTSQVIVRSTETVADGDWHSVTCHKTPSAVQIVVDGHVTQLDEAAGTVSNDAPIVIGGSGLAADDDQFHGRIDDVFLWVDSARG